MNALYILDLYYRVKDDPSLDVTPRVFIFGAKAAPGYIRAKGVIKLINAIADLVNNDPELCTTDHWPQPGERVRVACLGVWPDGELRMTMRKLFIDMLSKPYFRHLAPHAPHPPSSNTIGGQSR